MKLYVASSWRNPHHGAVVAALEAAGWDLYDYRRHGAGFHWRDLDPAWAQWGLEEVRLALEHPKAQRALEADRRGLDAADAGVLVLPAGASSHVEVGRLAGRGKPVVVWTPPGSGTLALELCYRYLTGGVVDSELALLRALDRLKAERGTP